MTKNFIHFLSETPCAISINGQNIGYIDNSNTFELDIITNTTNVYVTYSPLSHKNYVLPYTFNINNNDINALNSDYIKVVPFPNNQYDIIMKPFYYYQIETSKVLLNQTVGNLFVNILNDNKSNITIYSGASIVFTITTVKLENAKVYIKSDYLIIEGIIDKENYYLLILDIKDFSIIYNDITQSIENTDEYLQIYKKLNTIPKHAEICKIDYKVKSKDTYYVYQKEFPELPKNNMLIPFSMLEAIKVGDENVIKDSVDNNLSATPINYFKNYFGDIQEIYLNRHIEPTNKINYTVFNGNYKNYNFIINGNKIADIEEIF